MNSIPKHTIDFIDSWLELRSKWADVPGFSVAIAKDGKVIFDKSYGFANLEQKEKLTTDHIFRIASHSKTFTATAIMQLQEQGKLRIDDSVIGYLSWLKDHKDERWQSVTIRQLLSHSAGVIRDGLDSNYWTLARSFPTSEELQKAILETELVIEPNTKLKYSNYGYSLLGEIIGAVSGSPYGKYMTERIIEPVGLKNTFPELTDELKKKLSTGYSRQNIKKQRLEFPHVSTNAMAAATGFCSTASDLVKYFSALTIGSGGLLSDESKREMQRIQWPTTRNGMSYGLGLDIDESSKRKLIGHSGGFPGFISRSLIDADDTLAVTVLTNCHGAVSGRIAKAIYELIDEFGDTQPEKQLLKYEGRFTSLYGSFEIVAHAGGLRSFYPNSWFPLEDIEHLEIIDDTTLKVAKAGSFNHEGETVHYTFNRTGEIENVVYGGSLMLPSDDGDLKQTWK